MYLVEFSNIFSINTFVIIHDSYLRFYGVMVRCLDNQEKYFLAFNLVMHKASKVRFLAYTIQG